MRSAPSSGEDASVAGKRAEEGAALCADRGFRLFGAMATMIKGRALAENGNAEAGATRVANGLAAFAANGAGMMLHVFLALLGEAHRRAGRLEQALAAIRAGPGRARDERVLLRGGASPAQGRARARR